MWKPHKGKPLMDEEGRTIDSSDALFENIPRAPKGWTKASVCFRLSKKEKSFLTGRLSTALLHGSRLTPLGGWTKL